jgi:hypothetical protein
MEFEYKGYQIDINQDIDPENPREAWDNLGTMVCFHGRYNLGDKTDLRSSQFTGWDELETHLRENLDAVVILPLYLYDHGGITMNTTGFSCRWDSGQVGFIYVTREKLRKEYDWKRVSPQRRERVAELLRGEVQTYDQYLTGDIYGYSITKDGEDIDSCYGFYGSDYCEEAAKEYIEYLLTNPKTYHNGH